MAYRKREFKGKPWRGREAGGDRQAKKQAWTGRGKKVRKEEGGGEGISFLCASTKL